MRSENDIHITNPCDSSLTLSMNGGVDVYFCVWWEVDLVTKLETYQFTTCKSQNYSPKPRALESIRFSKPDPEE